MNRVDLTSTQNRGSPSLTGGRGADIVSALRGGDPRSSTEYRYAYGCPDPNTPLRGSWATSVANSVPNAPFTGSTRREPLKWVFPPMGDQPSRRRPPPYAGDCLQRPTATDSCRPTAMRRSAMESLIGTSTQGSAQQRLYRWRPRHHGSIDLLVPKRSLYK